MSLVDYAKSELKVAGLFDKDSDYDGELGKSVLELVEVFAEQGHSGFSANQTVNIFNKVARYQPLTPIQNIDSEWVNVHGDTFQNNRCSALFKEGKDGKPYYIDAISWKTQKGICWNGSADKVLSRAYVKSFPFTPKTFVIDVIEEEVAPDDWEFHIKNINDMDKVWEYYEPYDNNKVKV